MNKFQISNFKFQILVLLLFICGSAEAQGIFKIDSIPAPPQSTRLETRKEQATFSNVNLEANITHYQSPLSPDVVIGFYKQHLPVKGWEAIAQESQDSVAIAAFIKDEESVSITAYALRAGSTDIYISRSAMPKIDQAPQVQGQDVPGRDLAWAPRYPGAIRSLYREDKRTGVVMVSYSVSAEPNEIIAFYQRKMADNGWRFINDVKLGELPGIGGGSFTTLFFKGAQGQCQVSINKATGFKGIDATAVLLNYMPDSAIGRMR